MSRARRRSMRLSRQVSLAIAAGVAVLVPTVVVAGIGSSQSQPEQALMASAAWHDWVSGQRTPQVIPADDTESAIVMLDGSAITDVDPADRADAITRIQADQLAVEGEVQGLGGVVTHRYRTLINALAVRVPAGHIAALGEIKGISAVVPVRYLAPAAATASDPVPTADGASGADDPAPTGGHPAHIALIDAGVDTTHPWLGGGIGANRLIIGGQDLVDVDGDPSPDPADPAAEAHGTQMASILLRSPALSGLPPAQVPRLLAYRVTAREQVDGQVRTLARSDRVLAALEMAADPNRDGLPDDTADVIMMGLARGFGGSGVDPVALALSAANRAGAVVVVPAGNDGPTGLVPGSVGQPASAPGVLSVGGLSGDTSPRTADLTASVGPAAAALANLPLLGSEPDDSALSAGLPLVLASGSDGVGTGLEVGDFAGPDGRSTVAGAIAMVTRGGAPLGAVARKAAAAGAKAILVWDADGTGAFPGVSAGADAPIPIVGLGSAQGKALIDLFRRNPTMTLALTPHDVTAEPVTVASFSSTGPSALARLEPQMVAPAVGVEAAFPGRDDAGHAQEAPLTGTSAAAAVVAAEALRLRIDHPDWTPADVRSVLVQSAHPVSGATATEQGAGAAPDPASISTRVLPGVSFDPPILSGPISRDSDSSVGYTLHDLTGTGGRYRVLMQAEDGTYVATGEWFELAPGGRHKGIATIPRGPETGPASYRGRLVVAPVGGEVAAGSAMVWATTRPRTPGTALGSPSVHRQGPGLGVLTVRVGMRDALAVGLNAVTLHDVQVTLQPVGGGAPIRMGSAEPSGDWPAARYDISLTKRDARGAEVPAGYYRVVVTATGPDGTVLGRKSAPFRVR